MGNRIPDDVVDGIRNAVDIVDVIGEYVQLKKQGRNYFGLCPFHGEKSPSFSVSADKQIFHCFGCGAGGNAISFLMKIEGIGFNDALHKLSKKTHTPLVLEEYSSSEPLSNDVIMFEAHELLKRYYQHLLFHTDEGEQALHYLKQRGLTEDIIQQFEIGYAPSSWDMATRFLAKKGYALPIMEQAGLVIEKENETGAYDRFRERVMFPIFNSQGKVIGFSGRIIGEGSPKYLNTPETPIFKKGHVLYHLHKARQAIRQKNRVILFEGFADVIASVRSGLEESVATMGTAITTEQASLLRRLTDQVVLCYDADSAGIEASFKATKLFQSQGFQVKVALMPTGLDPDDYTKQFGSDAFREKIIEQALNVMNFKMHYYKLGKNLRDDAQRMNYIQQVLMEISGLQNPIEREHYMKMLSEEYHLSLDVLREELGNLLRKHTPNVTQQRPITPPKKTQKLLPAYYQAERHLIAHMLINKEIAEKVQKNLQGFFNIDEHTEIIVHLYAYYEDGNEPDVSQFLSELPNEGLKSIVTEIAYMDINKEISDESIQDYLQHIQNRRISLEIETLQEQLKAAERAKEYVKAAQIGIEITRKRLTINK